MTQTTLIEQSKSGTSLHPDNEIAAVADLRLKRSPYFPLRAVTCQFHEGVLILRGQVTSWHLKQLAQETVRTLKEVDVIHNAVEVARESNSSSG